MSIIYIIAIAFIGYYFYSENINNKNKSKSNSSVQDIIGVKNIKDRFLYNTQNEIISFIKVEPINLALLSKRELKIVNKRLVGEMASIKYPYKYIAVSRPVDVKEYIEERRNTIKDIDDYTRKDILKSEIKNMLLSIGENTSVERQFYIAIAIKNKEGAEEILIERANEIQNIYDKDYSSRVIEQKEIMELCNMVFNPNEVIEEIDEQQLIEGLPMIDWEM